MRNHAVISIRDNRTLDDVLREKDASIAALRTALAEAHRTAEWAFRELRRMADESHENAWKMGDYLTRAREETR